MLTFHVFPASIFFRPVFYLDALIDKEDIDKAKASWSMITNDTAPGFLALKGTPGFDFPSCIMMFFDTFYSRLFDVHPMCRPMFKSGLKSQGKFLVKMISMAVSLIDDNVKFTQTLVKLTETHNVRGVKAIECEFCWHRSFCYRRACFVLSGVVVVGRVVVALDQRPRPRDLRRRPSSSS